MKLTITYQKLKYAQIAIDITTSPQTVNPNQDVSNVETHLTKKKHAEQKKRKRYASIAKATTYQYLQAALLDKWNKKFKMWLKKQTEIHLKYAANCTGSKLSQCSAIIFSMRLSHRIRQYQLQKNL